MLHWNPSPESHTAPTSFGVMFNVQFKFIVISNCASYPRVNILPPDGFTLRTYPQGFADYVRDLLPDLVGGSERVEVDETQCPYQLFENLPFSTWEEAKLVPALKYARGNKHLNIPPEWLQVFPSPFEILHKLEEQRLDQRGQD